MYNIICDTALHWNFAYTVKSFIPHGYVIFVSWMKSSISAKNEQ